MEFGHIVNGTSALKPVYSEPQLRVIEGNGNRSLKHVGFSYPKSTVEQSLDNLEGTPFCTSRREKILSSLAWTIGIGALFFFSFVFAL